MEYIEKKNFSPFNSSKVIIMNYLFGGCCFLISIDFTKFDSSAATDMNYMFSRCYSFRYINLSISSTINSSRQLNF